MYTLGLQFFFTLKLLNLKKIKQTIFQAAKYFACKLTQGKLKISGWLNFQAI